MTMTTMIMMTTTTMMTMMMTMSIRVCNGVLGRMWHLHLTASPLSRNVQSAPYSVHCLVWIAHRPVWITQCALCIVHCSLCNSVVCSSVHYKCAELVDWIALQSGAIVSDGGSALGADRSTLESASLSKLSNNQIQSVLQRWITLWCGVYCTEVPNAQCRVVFWVVFQLQAICCAVQCRVVFPQHNMKCRRSVIQRSIPDCGIRELVWRQTNGWLVPTFGPPHPTSNPPCLEYTSIQKFYTSHFPLSSFSKRQTGQPVHQCVWPLTIVILGINPNFETLPFSYSSLQVFGDFLINTGTHWCPSGRAQLSLSIHTDLLNEIF